MQRYSSYSNLAGDATSQPASARKKGRTLCPALSAQTRGVWTTGPYCRAELTVENVLFRFVPRP